MTPTDIAEELWRTRKIRVDRRKIDLDVIKRIGRYSIPVHVFEGVTAEVKTLVVPEGGELPPEEELAALEAAERAEAEAAAARAAEATEAALAEDEPEDAAARTSPRRSPRPTAEPTTRHRAKPRPRPTERRGLCGPLRLPQARPHCPTRGHALWTSARNPRSERPSAAENNVGSRGGEPCPALGIP